MTIRLLDLHEPPGSKTDASLWEFARKSLPTVRFGDYNQALMDLGSAVCTPTNPQCPLCPLQAECLAFQRGTQSELPLRKPKAKVPHRLVVAGVITCGNEVLLARRPANGMLGNLWEYPGGSVPEESADLPGALKELLGSRFGLYVEVGAQLGVFKHAYTHFRITLHAFTCQLSAHEPISLAPNFAWITIEDLSAYPMGKVARLISQQLAS